MWFWKWHSRRNWFMGIAAMVIFKKRVEIDNRLERNTFHKKLFTMASFHAFP